MGTKGLLQIICVTISVLAIRRAGAAVDPCLKENHNALKNLGSRNEQCVPDNMDLNHLLCDNYLPTDWYKTENAVMLNHEPKTGRCGVDIPLWLIDPFPNISDEIIDRDACVKTDDDACNETVTIQIKNCSTFYVYKLQQLPDHLGCPAAYCFVSNALCHELDTSTTKTQIRPMSVNNVQDTTYEGTPVTDVQKDGQHYKTTTALIACLTISVCVIAVLVVVVVVLAIGRKRHPGIGAAEKLYVNTEPSSRESPPPVYDRISSNYTKY